MQLNGELFKLYYYYTNIYVSNVSYKKNLFPSVIITNNNYNKYISGYISEYIIYIYNQKNKKYIHTLRVYTYIKGNTEKYICRLERFLLVEYC